MRLRWCGCDVGVRLVVSKQVLDEMQKGGKSWYVPCLSFYVTRTKRRKRKGAKFEGEERTP